MISKPVAPRSIGLIGMSVGCVVTVVAAELAVARRQEFDKIIAQNAEWESFFHIVRTSVADKVVGVKTLQDGVPEQVESLFWRTNTSQDCGFSRTQGTPGTQRSGFTGASMDR